MTLFFRTSMFEIVEWNKKLNLDSFYSNAAERNFVNNASREMLVDCFNNEIEKQVWILYFNKKAVGSVAAHSFFDVMGNNAYRIAARTCVFTDLLIGHRYSKNLRTKSVITKHQNPTAQFLLPACLEWVPNSSKVYITTNNLQSGNQSRVNRIFAPLMQRKKIMRYIKEVIYRNTIQTVWEFNKTNFLTDLNKYPRWN